MSKRTKILIIVVLAPVLLLLGVWMTGSYVVAKKVCAPQHRRVEPRADIEGKPVLNETIMTEDGIPLSAWYVKNAPDRAVVFLAGIGSNRRQFNSRAEYYVSVLGYSVLMPDLRGTGESGGDMISIGWHERKDLKACRDFLRAQGHRYIGAHGISLGAATICYAMKEVNDLSFVVLESSYDTIEHAIYNRVDEHNVPHFLVYPACWMLYRMFGTTAEEMQPVSCIQYCKAPTFVMGGDAEGFLKLSETMDIYNRCPAQKKRLHIFKDGHHESFLKRYPEEFKGELKAFLDDVQSDWAVAAKQ